MPKYPRIIVNSRYCRVARSGEQTDGKNIISGFAMENLVQYVGTREGVVFNQDNGLNLPVTEKQTSFIQKLLDSCPDITNLIEYADYQEASTRANASALISAGAEMLLLQGEFINQETAETLTRYVATRPGVSKSGEHGLFGYRENINLQEAAKELSGYEGRIWRHIVSLRREDADKLGYNTQQPWKLLIEAHLHELAEASGIKPENLRWYAGMHDEGHHPHIHLFVFSANPKEGYVTAKDIKKMESMYAKDIFREEMKPVYAQKTKYRDTLNQTARELLHLDALQNTTRDAPMGGLTPNDAASLMEKLRKLSDTLPTKGRMFYKFMPPAIKQQIDKIAVDLLNSSPVLTELFEKWQETQKEIDKTYLEEPEKRSFEKEPSFNVVKNAVIQAAIQCRSEIPKEKTDEKFRELALAAMNGDTKAQYRYGKELVRLGRGDEADTWLGLASAHGHIFASYELAALYDSQGNKEMAAAFFGRTFDLTIDTIKNSDTAIDILYSDTPKKYDFEEELLPDSSYNGKLEELIGKLLENGIGRKPNREQAKLFYEMAFHHGCDYLSVKLGRMAQEDEQPLSAAYWFMKASEKNIPAGQYALAQYLESGSIPLLGKDIEAAERLYEKAAAAGYRQTRRAASFNESFDSTADTDEPLPEKFELYAGWTKEYKEARLFLYGSKTQEPDLEKAYQCMTAEAQKGNAFAMHDLGKMLLSGVGCDENAEEAHEWFRKALGGLKTALTKEQNKTAQTPKEQAIRRRIGYLQFRIGKMYSLGYGAEKSPETAAEWFQKAVDMGNPFAAYSLGSLYRRGEGVEQNDKQAFSLFLMAASDKISPNAYAMYQLGGMYQNGIGTEQDLKESERWYQRAYQGFLSLEEKSRDDKLWYRLGQMNMAGIGTAVNLEAAKLYFNRSAAYGNTDAEYGLGCLYANPDFSEYNIPKSIEHFFKAAEAQNQFAQYQLGRLYLGENEDIPRDIEKALSFLQLSADQGNQFAQYQLGRLYLGENEDIPRNIEKALSFLQLSADQGNQFAQYQLGRLYLGENENIPRDIEKVLSFLQLSADQGNQFAQYQLGRLYLGENEDIPRDIEKALSFLQLSADQGNQFAQYQLGRLYLGENEDIPRNIEKALSFLQLSADQGNQFAQYQLGKLYLGEIEDIPKDIEKALSFLQLSADQGNQFAQYQLGRLYLGKDEDTPKDTQKALSFLQLSADQGNSFAMYQLGGLYFYGDEGIPKDMDKALFYLQASAELGNEYAQSFLDYIERGYQPISNLLYCGASIFSSPIRRHLEKQLYAADHTLIREEQKKKAALGHNRNDHKHTMTY